MPIGATVAMEEATAVEATVEVTGAGVMVVAMEEAETAAEAGTLVAGMLARASAARGIKAVTLQVPVPRPAATQGVAAHQEGATRRVRLVAQTPAAQRALGMLVEAIKAGHLAIRPLANPAPAERQAATPAESKAPAVM